MKVAPLYRGQCEGETVLGRGPSTTFLRNSSLDGWVLHERVSHLLRAPFKVRQDALLIPLLVVVRSAIHVLDTEAKTVVEDHGELASCGRYGLGFADAAGEASIEGAESPVLADEHRDRLGARCCCR